MANVQQCQIIVQSISILCKLVQRWEQLVGTTYVDSCEMNKRYRTINNKRMINKLLRQFLNLPFPQIPLLFCQVCDLNNANILTIKVILNQLLERWLSVTCDRQFPIRVLHKRVQVDSSIDTHTPAAHEDLMPTQIDRNCTRFASFPNCKANENKLVKARRTATKCLQLRVMYEPTPNKGS